MKKLFKTSLILLSLLSMLFVSCRKEYEKPVINPVPFGDTLTIGDILAMAPKTTFDTASVCGIVTADEQSGNLYKVLFIQDPATGQAIELKLNSSSAARIGDSVRVCLDPSIMYNPYHNLPQLIDVNDKGINPDGHLVIYPYNRPIEPKKVTIADIKSGNYVGMLVQLDSVEFVEKNAPFCEIGETTNRHLVDATSPTSDDNFVVRTSNYANFAYDYMPVSKGNMVAIVSVYNSTYQLLIRSKKEMDFAVWGVPPVPAGELQSMPYIQSFDANFGTYTTFSVEGTQTWTIEYSSAKITGHEGGSGGVDYANEDWLISSPVAIAGVEHAKAVVNYAAKYTAPVEGDVTLQVSADYEFGKDPTTATWVELPVKFENNSPGNSWTFTDQEASLDQFIGQEVCVAVKFISTTSGSRTIEIKSITIEDGEAGSVGPTTLTGNGTRENPYTASDVILLGNSQSGKYWVTGYVVGVIDNNNNNTYEFTATTSVASNIIIASDKETTNENECVPVQLVSGSAVRAGLNLKDHDENYQKSVLIYGSLENYFSKPGVKSPSYAEINGNSYGTEPNTGGIEYFNEEVATQAGFESFTAYSVTGDQVWHFDPVHTNYGAQMSGFDNNVSYANEDWFISPAVDLSGSTNPVLTFEHTRGPAGSITVGVSEGYYTVWVSNNYTEGDPTQVQWVELTGVNHATSAWGWVSSGALAIPAEFKTATCRFALCYKSIDGASATWEVKNFVIKEQ